MDIFSRQDDVAKRSRIFQVGFFLAVILTVLALYYPVNNILIFVLVLLGTLGKPFLLMLYGEPAHLVTPQNFIVICGGIATVILLVARHRREELLNGGGAFVAHLLGGVEVIEPANPNETQLVNVIEEMAIASGLPRPMVFILPHEPGINAITAGEDAYDSVIAVTQGALDTFSRRELQAVIAHEFGHIMNGDSAMNLHLAGWLYGLVFVSAKGKDLMHISLRSGPTGILVIFGLAIWVAGWVGKISAQLLQAALSRQREYLADAFAAQFTREPQALADALKKIGGSYKHGVVNSGQSLAFQSFFIASPTRGQSLLKTHPPLEKRIFALEPNWDGQFPEMARPNFQYTAKPPRNPATPRGKQLLKEKLAGLDQWSNVLLAGILASEGKSGVPEGLDKPDLASARGFLDSMPPALKEAINRPEQMPALVAAVFLQEESVELYQKQLRLVEHFFDRQIGVEAHNLKLLLQAGSEWGDQACLMKLPLLDLAAPTLRSLSPDQKRQLLQMVKALIAADQKIDLYDIAAGKILEKCLGKLFSDPSGNSLPANTQEKLNVMRDDAALILSAMAHVGSQNPNEAEKAFEAGWGSFNQWGARRLAPASELSSQKLLKAMDRFSEASLIHKNSLLTGAAACALHDQQINKKEYELLRSLAAALDLTLPYWHLAETSGQVYGPCSAA